MERPEVVASSGSSLYMKFTSNQMTHGKGFRMQYRRHSLGEKYMELYILFISH